jgi:DNA replication protein DnaC
MSTQQTVARLRELRLASMAEAYEWQLQQPRLHELPFDDRLALLVEQEVAQRENRKLKRLLKGAGFPEVAALEDLDYRGGRGLDKAQIASLAGCEWVRRQQNLVIHGATGVGKTWLACALGSQACRLKIPVVFHRASDLYSTVMDAIHDGSLIKLKLSLSRPSLLIIDDFGLGDIAVPVAQFLLDLVDRRMRTGALMITSQYASDQWHGFFPDPTVADAVLDRVVHQAHRLTLKGESMRKVLARDGMKGD